MKNEARRLLRHMKLDAHMVEARPASAFSTGQQQRIAVARALIGKEEGDSVEVTAPGGSRSYEITSVEWV